MTPFRRTVWRLTSSGFRLLGLRHHGHVEAKRELLLHQLGIPYERFEVDITRGATRTPEFLARNPNGRIPLLELEDGSCLAESNAIQFYLAEGTDLLPDDRLERARVLQWMFFEQYSHEPYIAVVRYWHHVGVAESRPDEVATRIRMLKTQNIIAVAEMSDGTLYRASKNVKVTIGGCGG